MTTADIDIGFDMAYEAHFLYRDEILWHHEHYLASPARTRDLPASPRCNGDAARPAAGRRSSPPSAIPLHPQAERYRDHLQAAGVPVEYRSTPA